MTIKYVFWDSDNTLVDTASHHWNKHYKILQDNYGITLGDRYKKRIYENNGSQNWAWLSDELGLKEDKERYLDHIDNWYMENAALIDLRDGVSEALNFLKAQGIPQAVVSNGRRRSVMAALKAKKLDGFFEFILCKEDYEGRKPDPAPYLAALKRMEKIKGVSISPEECLAIEDDPLGVQAANAAGMVSIHRKLSPEQVTSCHASHIAYEGDEFAGLITKLFLRPCS